MPRICPKCGAQIPAGFDSCPVCSKTPEDDVQIYTPRTAAPVQPKSSKRRVLAAALCAAVLAGGGLTLWRLSRENTPEKTAEICSKYRFVCSAISLAIVVLPQPGGPQRINEDIRPVKSILPKGESSPNTCSCPTTSSSFRGRSRSAKGRLTLFEKSVSSMAPAEQN